ncbi:MAG TPA: LD-carboxypeptidase [Thermoanaerobaculia bacterium]|nr:LD-carboxypeptidase [Thermoanaerobaculia bacterium]
MLTRPRAVSRNCRIAVLAAASPSELHRIETAAAKLERAGARVTLAPNIATVDPRHSYLAADDQVRAAELNHYLRSDEFDLFLFSRGGYGAMRILDAIDYQAILRNPRALVGFSDVTAIHQAMAIHASVGSFHGPMLNLDFFEGLSPANESWFWAMLGGEAPLTYRFDGSQIISGGDAEGVLFGGCLSLTASLVGTPYDFAVEGGIWFWEDVDESPYRIDRMLTHLRLSGRLQSIRGVIVGKLKNCGTEAEVDSLLREFFGDSGIPVVRDFPFGHHGDNLLMPIGAPVHLSTDALTFTLLEPAVA